MIWDVATPRLVTLIVFTFATSPMAEKGRSNQISSSQHQTISVSEPAVLNRDCTSPGRQSVYDDKRLLELTDMLNMEKWWLTDNHKRQPNHIVRSVATNNELDTSHPPTERKNCKSINNQLLTAVCILAVFIIST